MSVRFDMKITRKSFLVLGAFALSAILSGCATGPQSADSIGVIGGERGPTATWNAGDAVLRVGSYNIRFSGGDLGTPNAWECRKADVIAMVKKLNLDAFGMQEVCPDQMAYLRENLPEFAFVGDHRGADRKSGEASPVAYRKSRFEAEKSGTFWLSETPDVPASKSWGTAIQRVCSYLVLRDRETGKRFCFANTHTDHISAEAREKGMLLIIERMKEFGAGAPIVFTGDHNCCYDHPPAKAVRKVLKDARDITESPAAGPHNTFQGFGKFKDGPIGADGFKDYCIDYIYVSEGTRVLDFVTHADKRPGTDLYPSDHFPVTATIVVGK